MFTQAPFLNQYSKSVVSGDSNMNRILNGSASQPWDNLNQYQDKTMKEREEGRMTGFSDRLQGAMDMNPRTVNERIAEERRRYNEYMLQNSGINRDVVDGAILDRDVEKKPVQTHPVERFVAKTITEPFDMKVKGRCNISDVIIVVFVIIVIFIFVNMYVSQKRMELMLHYYGKYMKYIRKKED